MESGSKTVSANVSTKSSCELATSPSQKSLPGGSSIAAIEMPSSVPPQSQMYLSYKSHNTAKGLVGIAPSGIVVTFTSCLCGVIYLER